MKSCCEPAGRRASSRWWFVVAAVHLLALVLIEVVRGS